MDREQEEIQFMSFFGIIKESCNIVSTWRKIFAKITLILILPLSFIYLAHIQISQILFRNIMREEFMLDNTTENTRAYDRIVSVLTSDLIYFFLFKLAYLVFFVILALLSTSAVVYTVACIYTAKEITFRKVMSVVPKVWKRLIITFIWNFIILFAYNVVSVLIVIIIVLLFATRTIFGVLIVLFALVYLVGLLYITIIWHLASVVSVLEDSYGIEAMFKSKGLIKGKMGISVSVFLVLGLFLYGIQLIFEAQVVHGGENGIGGKIGFGILSLVLMCIWMVFGLIIQTIIYFICKSYHHENIDKSLLADHLEGYLGEYVPLKSKDVQLHQFDEEV